MSIEVHINSYTSFAFPLCRVGNEKSNDNIYCSTTRIQLNFSPVSSDLSNDRRSFERFFGLTNDKVNLIDLLTKT